MANGKQNGIGIRRLFAEGVMVVASILVAFALDAWWEERQLEQEMREDLTIVQAELTENIRLAEQMIEMMGRVTDAGDSIVDAMLAKPDAAQIEVPGQWLYWGMFNNPTLDPSLGAIDAWIATGRLAGIRNAELRKRLASVRGKVDDVTEEQHIARELGTRDLYPLLSEVMNDLGPIAETFAAGLTQRQRIGVHDIAELEPMAIPNGNGIQLLMQARILWYRASLGEMGDFRDELLEIQALLNEELER